MDEAGLLRLKALLAPKVLKIPGVSGLGIGEESLNVYIGVDDEQTRASVEAAVRAIGGEVPIHFIVSGPFKRT